MGGYQSRDIDGMMIFPFNSKLKLKQKKIIDNNTYYYFNLKKVNLKKNNQLHFMFNLKKLENIYLEINLNHMNFKKVNIFNKEYNEYKYDFEKNQIILRCNNDLKLKKVILIIPQIKQ